MCNLSLFLNLGALVRIVIFISNTMRQRVLIKGLLLFQRYVILFFVFPLKVGLLTFVLRRLLNGDYDLFVVKVEELAQEHHELNHLTSTDLSHYSWFSVAWYCLFLLLSSQL